MGTLGMRIKVFFLVMILSFSPIVVMAQLKPMAMLLPVNFINYSDKTNQKRLQNYLQAELSNYFEMKTPQEVREAQIAAGDLISSENCSEEECIKKMGELLDVEYTFKFELIVSDSEWDINASKVDYSGMSSIRNEICSSCSLKKARQILSETVMSLRPGATGMKMGMASLSVISAPRAGLFVNGRKEGMTPSEISVKAQEEVDILIVKEGYNDYAETLVLKPGQKFEISKKLSKKRGRIRILSRPTSAMVFLNGEIQKSPDGSPERTPIDLRPTYGTHKLQFKLEKYKDFETTIEISERDHGRKTFQLKPIPGRLLIRVPSANRNARVFFDGNYVGSMSGVIAKSFEIPAEKTVQVQVRDGLSKSPTKSVSVDADSSETLQFNRMIKPEGFRIKFGGGVVYSRFNYKFETANKPINTSYGLTGFELNSLLTPSRYRLRLIRLNGNGEFTDRTSPFFIVSGADLYTISETSAEVLRLMIMPGWGPGLIYGIGYEMLQVKYTGSGTSFVSKRNSLIVEGGYEFSDFFGFMIDNELFLETNVTYSSSNHIGLSVQFGGLFF